MLKEARREARRMNTYALGTSDSAGNRSLGRAALSCLASSLISPIIIISRRCTACCAAAAPLSAPFQATQILIMEVTLLLTKSPADSLCYTQSGEIKSPFISARGEAFQRLVRRALMRWYVTPPVTAACGTPPVVCWL